MRFFLLMVLCAVLATTVADPEPKKFKAAVKKAKPTNTTLTDEEIKFLREVESKFGIKADSIDDKKKVAEPVKGNTIQYGQEKPFPAVIAIEIVNDTDSKSKGTKRTIDANLGYGYKTNGGYSYSYFGKPAEDQGKFMIYPYSQEDIPAAKGSFTQVEITPSRAFELVEEKEGYDYPKPSTEFKDYDNVQGLVLPPPSYHSSGNFELMGKNQFIPSTLFTTYNGQEFSDLSGQFPKVKSNYLVDPSQLLKTPEFQNVGLTNDHLRVHGNIADQQVVPVLVLRIPSSSLKNPTAELFANLPSNYPFSNSLNNVNLQELVNQYFKKVGYSIAPQLTNYHDSIQSSPDTTAAGVYSNYGRQQYASPQIQPTYTQVDHSGVQYSAVQPVMARYPSSYTPYHTNRHTLYQLQRGIEYGHRHVQTSLPQTYYEQTQYPQQEHVARPSVSSGHSSAAEVEYESVPQVSNYAPLPKTYINRPPVQGQGPRTQSQEELKVEYEYSKHEVTESTPPSYEYISELNTGAQEYRQQEAIVPKQTIAVIPSQASYAEVSSHSNQDSQNYHYQQNSDESKSHGLSLTENYPSKDHTIATVLPVSYSAKTPNVGAVQTVSYVTPMPYSSKYKSPYKIMVPQTFLMNPAPEKVAYVNSHTVSSTSQQDYNPEAEYIVGPHYVPPISRQKPPAYPKNYHSHPKRMTKPERQEASTTMHRKNVRNEKKKST